MIHYPKASLRLLRKPNGELLDGGAMIGGPPRGVWHTTETNPLSPYTRDYYHLNLSIGDGGRPVWVQMMDLGRASRALRRPTDVQTNRQGDYCINVAISGYARDAGNWPAAIYQEMAELMVWCEIELGVPAQFPYRFTGGDAYGESGAVRLPVQGWIDLNGWVGHQHVPYNTHWDPGRIPQAELEAIVALQQEAYMPTPQEIAQAVWSFPGLDVDGDYATTQLMLSRAHRNTNALWGALVRGDLTTEPAEIAEGLVLASPDLARAVVDEINRRLAE